MLKLDLVQCRVTDETCCRTAPILHRAHRCTGVDRAFGDIPVVHGMPFVSGVGIEAYSKNPGS